MSEEITKLYIIMPHVPGDGYSLQSAGSGYTNAYQQGIAGLGFTSVPVEYFVFHHDYVTAKLKALEYTKQHGKPYYVATIQIEGRFVPPPPEFIPTYEIGKEWVKP